MCVRLNHGRLLALRPGTVGRLIQETAQIFKPTARI